MISNTEQQALMEEHHIIPVIRHLGIDFCNVAIDDKPDVVINNYEGKVIGVENVEYHSTNNIAKTDAKLWKICREYEQILKDRGEKGFQLSVHFSEYVYSLKRIDSKKVIEELEYCRNHENGKKYICYIMRLDISPNDVRVLQMKSGFVCNDIDYSIIRKLIEKKDSKLQEYKQLAKNKNIDEFWLNINIPFNEFSIYKQDDTMEIISGYDRIYISTYELGDTPLRIK